LGCSLFARHYSGNRDFFPFLRLLRCFSSPAYRAPPYVFRQSHARITARRFPHSDIPASQIGQHLHRAYRSRPRPSSALSAKASTVCPCSLDRKEHVCCHYGVFKVRASPVAHEKTAARSNGLSKLNSVINRGQRISRRPGIRTEMNFHQRARSLRSNSSGFPRKEVIQPQLPLRLPCYDFTPVTNPTFDGSLPCGLGHRLRVLPASVV
jgi:hypothetical protein